MITFAAHVPLIPVVCAAAMHATNRTRSDPTIIHRMRTSSAGLLKGTLPPLEQSVMGYPDPSGSGRPSYTVSPSMLA